MTVHRPLLREIRALAEEYPSAEECLEVAVSRGLLPEAATSDGHRTFVSSDGKRLETFVAWASLGWERIATAEALAAEFHQNADGAELPLRNIVWCIGGPLELGDDPAEAELVEMGMYVTLGINGQDVALHMPWRNSTGVPAVDSLLGGLHAKSLILIVGPAGAYKSTLAAMIAAGSVQQGSASLYGSTECQRCIAYGRAAEQGFAEPMFMGEDGTVRDLLDSFGRSPCDVMLLDGMAGMRYVALEEAVIDAKGVATMRRSSVFVTLHQKKDASVPGGVRSADVVLLTARSESGVAVTVFRNRYGNTTSAVLFTIGDGGRLVWDRTSDVASRRSLV